MLKRARFRPCSLSVAVAIYRSPGTGRIGSILLLLAVLSPFACSSDGKLAPGVSSHALDRTGPLAPSPTMIEATETNGNVDPITNLPLTDDLAPSPSVSVTPDGAAAVSLPLWVSPGRSGMQPTLSLSYNSRAGIATVGNAGTGWQVTGFPFIHRCPRSSADNGATANHSSKITFDGNDQLCLDNEPLVPETSGASSINTPNTAFRLLHDDHRRFVIKDVDDLGPTTIVAYDREGRTTTWGTSSIPTAGGFVQGPRYTFQTNPANIGYQNIYTSASTARYGLLLGTVVDRNGNGMDYSWYNFQCGNGDDLLPGNGVVVAPSQINYAWNSTTGLAATKYVSFQYDAIGCSSYSGNSPVYVAGMRIDSPRMPITGLTVSGPNSDGSASMVARQYHFLYADGSASGVPGYYTRSHLSEFLDCDGSDTCRPSVQFNYGEDESTDNEFVDITTSVTDIQTIVQSTSPLPPRIYTPDLNGDGRDDLLYVQANTTQYVARFSQGQLYAATPSADPPYATGPSLMDYTNRLFPADFTGRGFVTSALNTDDAPPAGSPSAQLLGLNLNTIQFQPLAVNMTGVTAGELADLNGDGLPDLIETTSPLLDDEGQPSRSMAWDYRTNIGNNQLTSGGGLPLGPNDHHIVDVDGDYAAEILTRLDSVDSNRLSSVDVGEQWSQPDDARLQQHSVAQLYFRRSERRRVAGCRTAGIRIRRWPTVYLVQLRQWFFRTVYI